MKKYFIIVLACLVLACSPQNWHADDVGLKLFPSSDQ